MILSYSPQLTVLSVEEAILTQGHTEPPSTIAEYQALAKETDVISAKPLILPLLGFFGEVGSLVSELKKKQRDEDAYIGYKSSVVEEIGDVLWYLACICSHTNTSMEEIARSEFYGSSPSPDTLTFGSLQQKCLEEAPWPTDFEMALLALCSETGAMISSHLETASIQNHKLFPNMAAAFRMIVHVANQAGINLDIAAARNLNKIFDRWPKSKVYLPLFDEQCEKEEQLPRLISIAMFEKKFEKGTYVYQQCNDVNIGDRLTDNKHEEDDYRFHDVFHLAYASVLGWSPVTRALFKVKRKSVPKLDENEDGARAIIVEEAISAWIFSRASQLNYFDGLTSLDYGLLKAVRSFTHGYEVHKCPLWMWEEAILQGYSVFRQLRSRRQGQVIADLQHRSLSFKATQK